VETFTSQVSKKRNPSKLFVSGLGLATEDEEFKKHFESFGELVEFEVLSPLKQTDSHSHTRVPSQQFKTFSFEKYRMASHFEHTTWSQVV
jgi:RNA recognition motif-containing protein